MAEYFKKYPKIDYKYRFVDSTGKTINIESKITNIAIKYTLSTSIKTEENGFYPYSWRDTDRPDSFSEVYYDTPNLFWLMLYSADVYDIFNELPKTQSAFYQYIYRKYRTAAIASGRNDTVEDVVAYTKTQVKEYRDGDNDVIDLQTFLVLNDSDKRIVSIFDFEDESNEKLRSVRILSSDYSPIARREFEDELNRVKKDLEGI